jgi:hypothetical protein
MNAPSLALPAWLASLGFLCAGLVAGLRHRSGVEAPERFRLAAITGAALFIGCYFLGTNFNYRLIVLILIVPSLLHTQQASFIRQDRVVPACALAVILLMFWSEPFTQALQAQVRHGWVLDEILPLLTLATCGWISAQHLQLNRFRPSHVPALQP